MPASRGHPLVGDIRGSGLFLGVELVKDRETLEPATAEAADVINRMRDRGILIGTEGPFANVLKIRPPMPFTLEDADCWLIHSAESLMSDSSDRACRSSCRPTMRRTLIRETLRALDAAAQALGVPYEIIVVDDASTDRTAAIAAAHGARIVGADVRQIGAARNAGARAARGDMLRVRRRRYARPARRARGRDRAAPGRGGRRRRLRGVRRRDAALGGRDDRRDRVVHADGAAGPPVVSCSSRRDAFERAGGFDERYFASEEIHLSRALKRLGRFVILREPVVTSGRKAAAYSPAHALWLGLQLLRPGSLRSRDRLGFWYSGRGKRSMIRPLVIARCGSRARRRRRLRTSSRPRPGARPAAALVESFDGLGVGFDGPHGKAEGRNPSDNGLAVGPDHIVQTVNSRLAVFTKKGKTFDTTGRVLYGAVPTNTVFAGLGGPCQARNNGDAVVRYDQIADRWLVTMPIFSRIPAERSGGASAARRSPRHPASSRCRARRRHRARRPRRRRIHRLRRRRQGRGRGQAGAGSRASPSAPPPPPPPSTYAMCYAISIGPDPLGPYYRYAFERPLFPDYPRPAIWIDGYYNPTSSSDDRISDTIATQKHACVVDRDADAERTARVRAVRRRSQRQLSEQRGHRRQGAAAGRRA